jgi:hypothetical protein
LISKTLKKLRGFLGLAVYYRKFVKNYGKIMTLLTTLLKKQEFSWTQEATKDFETLKEVVCTTNVLVTSDFTKTFIVECDSLGHSIGAVLMQEGGPLPLKASNLKEKTYSNPFMKNVGHTTCS